MLQLSTLLLITLAWSKSAKFDESFCTYRLLALSGYGVHEYWGPSQFFLGFSVNLLSYDSRSTQIRLDRGKNLDGTK